MGRWAHKTVFYEGYHELAYLHPDHFTPDPRVAAALAPEGTPYFILRFAKLNAHHDAGRTGITTEVATRLVALLEPHGRVYVTAERELEPELEPYRIRIDPQDMHSALASAHLYVGDSQTMAAEAAVLGTPSIRFNDFVGKIGYLDELEHRYGLTFGIRTTEPQRLYGQVEALIRMPDLTQEWRQRRIVMLAEKVNVTEQILRLTEQVSSRAEGGRTGNGHFRVKAGRVLHST